MPRKTTSTTMKPGSVYTAVLAGKPTWHRGRVHEDRYTTLAFVDYKGQRYTLAPTHRSLFTDSVFHANERTKEGGEGWEVFGEPERSRRSVAAEKRAADRKAGKAMTTAEKAALDRMVLKVLSGYDPRGFLPTVRALGQDIFNNHNYEYDDVDAPLTEAAHRTTYWGKAMDAAVLASLNRLKKAGKVTMMHGSGLRNRETKVFCLSSKLKD